MPLPRMLCLTPPNAALNVVSLIPATLVSQVGSGGPGMLWKLYKATPVSAAKKAVMAEVCVWLLDKKELADERAKRGTR